MENTRTIKFTFGEEVRRFHFVGTSYSDLEAKLRSVLGLPPTGLDKLSVKYSDSDGDLVDMSSDAELAEAFTLVKGKRMLRLTVDRKVVAPPAPKITAAPVVAAPIAPVSPISACDNTDPVRCGKNFAARKALREERMAARLANRQHREHRGPHRRGVRSFASAETAPTEEVAAPRAGRSKNAGRFVSHVTIEDGTELAPGTKFTKTWRFRNDGAADWPTGVRLMFVGKGDHLSGPEAVPVSLATATVSPGATVDASVDLEAPSAPGRYAGYWRLATAEGKKFGQRVWVQIVVPEACQPKEESEEEEVEVTPPSKTAEQKRAAKEQRHKEKMERMALKKQKKLLEGGGKKERGPKKDMKKSAQETAGASEGHPIVSAAQSEWEPFIRRLGELGLTIVTKPVNQTSQ